VARITVERIDPETFEVVVADEGSSTTHSVTASASTIADMGEGADAEAVVEASFRFLLDRESKESIMRAFDLTIIGRYFPEYRDVIGEYLVDG
jgi:hypothetical protein